MSQTTERLENPGGLPVGGGTEGPVRGHSSLGKSQGQSLALSMCGQKRIWPAWTQAGVSEKGNGYSGEATDGRALISDRTAQDPSGEALESPARKVLPAPRPTWFLL